MATKTATVEAQTAQTDVHHMLRTIGTQPHTDGTITGDQADEAVRTWLEAGYELFATHYAGDKPNGIRILYIFVKREPV